jgi:hypothetical protein
MISEDFKASSLYGRFYSSARISMTVIFAIKSFGIVKLVIASQLSSYISSNRTLSIRTPSIASPSKIELL